jgi:hypothetical protein
MKTLAIEVNGILRDFIKKFEQYYKIEFSDRDVKYPIDPFNPLLSFHFENDELENFIFQYAYELFGKSTLPSKEIIADLNQIYPELSENKYRIIIISREGFKFRSLTAFYISNFSASFHFDQIRFYNKFDEYVNENFDYILTTNPNLYKLSFDKTKVILFDPDKKYENHNNRINNIIEIFPLLENDRETNKN